MKLLKILGLSVALVAMVQAADDLEKNLVALIKDKIKEDAVIVKTEPLKSVPGIKLVIVEIKGKGDRFPALTSDKGDLFIGYNPRGIFSDNDGFNKQMETTMKELQGYMQELQTKREAEKIPKLKELFKSLPEDQWITVNGTDKKKKTKYIISDPECPYCRKELGNIDKLLEQYNVKMAIAPVHKRPAFIKGQLIYDEAKKAKTTEAKVAVIKKYFDSKYTLTEAQQKIEPKTVDAVAQTVFKSGLVRGVPFCFEPDTGKVGCGM